MAAVAEEGNIVLFGNPSWQWVSVADLPIQECRCFLDCRGNPGIQALNMLSHIGHVSFLEPRLLDFHVRLVRELACYYPVELVATTQGILDEVRIQSNPVEVRTSVKRGGGDLRLRKEVYTPDIYAVVINKVLT